MTGSVQTTQMETRRTPGGAAGDHRTPESARWRLLIADDETDLREALCEILAQEGYATTGFNSGFEALQALREHDFDALLTDLTMPGMDGIALLRAGLEIDPDLVGIVMTGQATIQTAVDAMKVGAFDYVLKPFELTPLLQTLARAMEVRRLRREKAQLEQRIAERTVQLEVANRELESFSYSVSHDLRAPLRAIEGFSRALVEHCDAALDVRGRDYVSRIRTATERMKQLIEDLLSLSQVTRSEIRRESVALSELAQKVAEDLQRSQPERRVQFVIAPGVTAQGDTRLLRVALENLLGNAWKFTSRHPQARIEFGVLQQGGETVYYVRDDGAGFEMEYAHRLFGTFQRLHASAEFEGTGIGLATVRRIIHRFGGQVWGEGAVEHGATFYFTLPGE